jgi:threonine synthase
MTFYSTNDRNHVVGFAEAVDRGIAPDGGLYMPVEIPRFPPGMLDSPDLSGFEAAAFETARLLLRDTIPATALSGIIRDSFTFPVRLLALDERLSVLELFHGPTLAFKDFGARFMARVVAWLHRSDRREITILVATSGDTGGAVASGFSGVDGARVILLYPAGRVSPLQELQLTTGGDNITALRVEGGFDDCQRLVKQAFADSGIVGSAVVTSANSINIARLLPQMFYYVWAWGQARSAQKGVRFIVPSGNLGNLTAGLLARAMGLPVAGFVAATNVNSVFGEYLQTGVLRPRPSVHTISNAMDVGDPSNLARIRALFGDDPVSLRTVVDSASVTDDETRAAIRDAFRLHRYLFDPHGAVGYRVAGKSGTAADGRRIVLATAHPAKFREALPPELRDAVAMPPQLRALEDRPRRSIQISVRYDDLRDVLVSI